MRKLIARFRKWKDWKRYNNMPWHYKLFVLLGICHSPTFEAWFFKKGHNL